MGGRWRRSSAGATSPTPGVPARICSLRRAPGARAGVTLHLPAPPAIALKGDERRLRQCVVNLLANAIKFAPRGEVTLAAATEAAGIEIRIADSGCSIPAAHIERVFEPFHQVENEFSRASNGTGLGLPLSRKLAERHGGTLALESTVGRAPPSSASPVGQLGSTGSGRSRRQPLNALISGCNWASCQLVMLCYNTAIRLGIAPCSFIPPRPR